MHPVRMVGGIFQFDGLASHRLAHSRETYRRRTVGQPQVGAVFDWQERWRTSYAGGIRVEASIRPRSSRLNNPIAADGRQPTVRLIPTSSDSA